MTSINTVRLSEIREVWESFSGWSGAGKSNGVISICRNLNTWNSNPGSGKCRAKTGQSAPASLRTTQLHAQQGATRRNAGITALPGRPPVRRKLKGGGIEMENTLDNFETATLCPTKAGRGFKVVVNGKWYYASKASVIDLVNNKAKACTFSTIKDDEPSAQ